jgi:cytochrome c
MTRTILAAAAAALLAAAAPAVAGDAAAGEKVFKKCAACHAVGANAKNKVGPALNGIVGRNVATVEGFKYSEPMIAHGGVWTEERIAEYLADPKGAVKGNKMAFAGLKKPEEIADVIAYLKTQN